MKLALFLAFSLPCAAQTLIEPGLWETRAPFPIQATEVSSAALAGKIYTLCGLTATGSSNALFIYDPRIDSWSPGAALPIQGGADHCNVATANGKIYLLGAIRVGSSFVDGNTYEYDPALNRWQQVSQMGTPRGASGVAAIGNRIYVAGGLAAQGSVADFEVFDAVSRSWSRLPAMPTARDHLTAQAVNDRIYAIAGRAGSDFTVNEEFDPATGAWRSRAPLPRARGGLASGVAAGQIVVFGGEGASGTPQNTFRENDGYDPATNTWRALAVLPTPRHGFYGATLDGRIFAPGGGPIAGASFSNAHEAFYFLPEWRPRFDGLRNGATFGAEVAPGSLASVFGASLTLGEQVATRLPLATQMNGVRVILGGRMSRLIYAGPNQINLEIPEELPAGPANLELFNAGWVTSSFPIEILAAAPGIFTLDASGSGRGAVLIAGTGILAQAMGGRPARRQETIEIYCTGLGRSPVQATVTIGGQAAEILYAGRAGSGIPGLDQINAVVPAGAPLGVEIPISIQVGGRESNRAAIAVTE